jgi:hypothetical protein
VSGEDFFVNWRTCRQWYRLLTVRWWHIGFRSGPARLRTTCDNGRAWTPSVTPHHDGTKTEHGFASLFQAPGAGLGLVWLDGRAMTPGAHEGEDAGAMSVRAAIFDRDGTQHSEMAVDTRVCGCCPTAAAVRSPGHYHRLSQPNRRRGAGHSCRAIR